jgi:hypothetical protein
MKNAPIAIHFNGDIKDRTRTLSALVNLHTLKKLRGQNGGMMGVVIAQDVIERFGRGLNGAARLSVDGFHDRELLWDDYFVPNFTDRLSIAQKREGLCQKAQVLTKYL